MARILAGLCINEKKTTTGAAFFDKSGRAHGPVFDSLEEAESFLSFLSGIDPADLDWSAYNPTDSGEVLLKMWVDEGKPKRRKPFQFDAEKEVLNEASEHEFCLDCDALDHSENSEVGPHCVCGEEWYKGDGRCSDDDGSEDWSFSSELQRECFPLFLGVQDGCHGVERFMRRDKVLTDEDKTDTERGFFRAFFKTKEQGFRFVERLNAWLRENWHKAYP